MSKVDGDEEEQREGESVVVTQSDVQQDKDDSVEQPELKEAVNEEPTHEEELEEKKQEVEGQPSTRQSDNDAEEKPASETAKEGEQKAPGEIHEEDESEKIVSEDGPEKEAKNELKDSIDTSVAQEKQEEGKQGTEGAEGQPDTQQSNGDSVEQSNSIDQDTESKEAASEEPTNKEEPEVEGQPSTRQSDNDAEEKPASETAEEGKQGISEETHEDNVEEQQASTAVAAPTRAETKRVDHTFKLINTLSDINEEIEEIKARVKDTGNVQEKINMMNRLGCCCQERMINNKELTVSTRRPDCKQQARPNPMTLSHR